MLNHAFLQTRDTLILQIQMATPAIRMFRRFEGLFCVYKPSGVHWKLVRDTIETNLLKGINATPALPVPKEVRFFIQPAIEAPATGIDVPAPRRLTAACVPVLAKHPLVTGPEFKHIRVGVGHRLDAFSSGVLVLAVGNGNKVLNELYKSQVSRDYTLEGEFGTAARDFSHTGDTVESSTYDHITQDKLERLLAVLQGANQKALLMYSNVDMRSQEAYEMAVQGLLGPDGKSPPILTGLRCVRFQLPHFTLEVQCLNETQKYLRKIVHEIGLELRSTAVCKGVRRTRDGAFTLQNALTHHHWSAADVMKAVRQYHATKKKKRKPPSQTKDGKLQTSEESLTTSSQQNENRDVPTFEKDEVKPTDHGEELFNRDSTQRPRKISNCVP